ncbi:MAG: hypothetical protein Q8N08_09730 [Methanobacteriaceae archaeon]|nr:hypothetical protein [Methanobacteriaceae archaeon]
MPGVTAPVTFIRETKGQFKDLTVPEEFVKDFYFRSDKHLMVMLRVVGTDADKVKSFFNDSEDHVLTIETTESTHGKEIVQEMVLVSSYLDEGPSLNVDINQEIPMVRLILDFQLK